MPVAGRRGVMVVLLLVYIAGAVGIAFGLSRFRANEIEALGSPDAHARWQEWKTEAARPDGSAGTVARRAPKSDEPPMLVLLRDHYPVIVAASLTLYTFLFGLAVFIGRGLWRGSRNTA